MSEYDNVNLRSPVTLMLYGWLCNNLVFYPVAVSSLYLLEWGRGGKLDAGRRDNIVNHRLSVFLNEVIYLCIQFIVLKCHIYLDQQKEDCVENKTDNYFQKEFLSEDIMSIFLTPGNGHNLDNVAIILERAFMLLS